MYCELLDSKVNNKEATIDRKSHFDFTFDNMCFKTVNSLNYFTERTYMNLKHNNELS